MSTFDAKKADVPKESKAGEQDDWSAYVPKQVSRVDTMDKDKADKKWELIYKAARASSESEPVKKGIRLGVYVYCCINGCSPESDYSGSVQTYSGLMFPAAVVPQSVGKHEVRRFLRAYLKESYNALKSSGAIENEAKYVAACASLGISAGVAFATADWMSDCPHFTPEELRAHEM